MDLTRSRSGCWTCRSRRVKCDETRPICRRCSRTKITCEYAFRLTWQEDNDARGLCHGRSGVWSKTKKRDGHPNQKRDTTGLLASPAFPSIKDPKFLNTTIEDVEMYLGYRQARSDKGELEIKVVDSDDWDVMEHDDTYPGPGSPLQALSVTRQRSRSSHYDPILLSYYEAVICSSSTLLDDEKNNPYRHVLLPMALQCPGVYHATLAISANILRLTQSDYAVIALDHRQKALQRLITLINNGEVDSREMDEICGLVLMLCWYEISDGCSPSWVQHLKGFRSLIDRHRQVSTTGSVQSLDLEQFFVRYFAFHLVLAKTTFQVDEFHSSLRATDHQRASDNAWSPVTDFTIEPQAADSGEAYMDISPSTSFLSTYIAQDSIHDIDPYMGFSNSLLLLINEITDLVHKSDDPAVQKRVLPRARLLKTSLENLQQHLPEFAANSSSLTTRRPAFVATAETYRLGAIVLLHAIVTQSKHATTMTGHNIVTTSELKDAIHSILQTIEEHLEDMLHTAVLPLWPLFIAGCCVDRDEDRVTALGLFEAIEHRKRFGNIRPARKVMEMVWRQRDLTRDQSRSPMGRCDNRGATAQYEWERASLLLGGWKISLT